MWKTDNPGSITFWYPMLQNKNKNKKYIKNTKIKEILWSYKK